HERTAPVPPLRWARDVRPGYGHVGPECRRSVVHNPLRHRQVVLPSVRGRHAPAGRSYEERSHRQGREVTQRADKSSDIVLLRHSLCGRDVKAVVEAGAYQHRHVQGHQHSLRLPAQPATGDTIQRACLCFEVSTSTEHEIVPTLVLRIL
ncbi:unnamed protein product, partial [Cyclocybe aegerita]